MLHEATLDACERLIQIVHGQSNGQDRFSDGSCNVGRFRDGIGKLMVGKMIAGSPGSSSEKVGSVRLGRFRDGMGRLMLGSRIAGSPGSSRLNVGSVRDGMFRLGIGREIPGI